MYAVIQTGGKQYRVAPGDTIRIERVKGDVGEQVKFGTVLAVHTDDKKVMAGAAGAKTSGNGEKGCEGRGEKDTLLKVKKTKHDKDQPAHPPHHTALQGIA